MNNVKLKGIVNVVGFKDNPIILLVVTGDVPDTEHPVAHDEGKPVWVDLQKLDEYKIFADIDSLGKLTYKTPEGQVFHAKSRFENKKLIEFIVDK